MTVSSHAPNWGICREVERRKPSQSRDRQRTLAHRSAMQIYFLNVGSAVRQIVATSCAAEVNVRVAAREEEKVLYWMGYVSDGLPCRRILGDFSLEGTAMNAERARRLGDVPSTVCNPPLYVVPVHAREAWNTRRRVLIGAGHG